MSNVALFILTITMFSNFTQPLDGKWSGYLLSRNEPNIYDVSFNFSVDKATDSVEGTMTLNFDIPIKSKQIHRILQLKGKAFADSIYLFADSIFSKPTKGSFHYRFFAKCTREVSEGKVRRFMQGTFVDSAQTGKTSTSWRSRKIPYTGVFLVESPGW